MVIRKDARSQTVPDAQRQGTPRAAASGPDAVHATVRQLIPGHRRTTTTLTRIALRRGKGAARKWPLNPRPTRGMEQDYVESCALRAGGGGGGAHRVDQIYDIAAGERGGSLLLHGGIVIAPTGDTDDHVVSSC